MLDVDRLKQGVTTQSQTTESRAPRMTDVNQENQASQGQTSQGQTSQGHYFCASCEALPITREEAREMLSKGLCDDCEAEARRLDWKPVDGLSEALRALNSSGTSSKVQSEKAKLRSLD